MDRPAESRVDPRSSSGHDESASEESYTLWYRHSSMEPLEEDFYLHVFDVKYEDLTVAELRQMTEGHTITHLALKGRLLPDIHSVAPELTHLSVREAEIDTIESLSKLQELQELDLSRSRFKSSEVLNFSSWPSLTALYLWSCGLKSLPDSLSQLKSLQKLNLFDNEFTSSDCLNCVSHLESLTELTLNSCGLKNLPDSFSQLQKLKVLWLSKNKFTSSNSLSFISHLKSLTELRLTDCGLEELPDSFSQLQKLEQLYLSGNKFTSSNSLSFISHLKSLTKLDLRDCGLEDLPDSFDALKNLKALRLDNSEFKELPASIYKLSNLENLWIRNNKQLTRIDSAILNLNKLRYIDCDDCTSLSAPPYGVCQQGIAAIKQYFTELAESGEVKVTVMPVAVLGRRMAGKTSFIRSLQTRQRTLTIRSTSNPDLDETTRVFRMEDLKLSNSHVRFVDFGGDEVYHLTYQFTIRDKCTPCVVVNMSEFLELSKTNGEREAARKLVFDWISHVYLASPSLPSPILILTHADLLSGDQFGLCRDQLIRNVEVIRHELLTEEKELSSNTADFCKIQHLADTKTPLFHPDDTYALGNDPRDNDTINDILHNLDSRSKAFEETIPGIWERVRNEIEIHNVRPYLELSHILSEFPGDMDVVLQYLHNIGRIFWFRDVPELSEYIFNDIKKVTEMIGVLFDHSKESSWAKRLSEFRAFKSQKTTIERPVYSKLVDLFQNTGLLDIALLQNLMKTETSFDPQLAIALMKAFSIIHGPIEQKPRCAYIVPYFSTKFLDNSWKTDGDLKLRSDILFAGLSPPQYVYQLVTVILLNLYSKPSNALEVFRNGAVIRHGVVSIYLVHDYNMRKITVQVSTTTRKLGPSWKDLLDIMNHILINVTKVWRAARPVCMFYCAHCLYVNNNNPDCESNPAWLEFNSSSQETQKYFTVTEHRGLEPVTCPRLRSVSGNKPTVPQPLRFPTFNLRDDELSDIERYLSTLKPNPEQTATTEHTRSHHNSECKRDHTGAIVKNLCPVTSDKVKVLYWNTEQVYQMSDGGRGRVLIINITKFFKDGKLIDERQGSEIDYVNLQRLFTAMNFVITDAMQTHVVTKDRVLRAIEQETKRPEHYGYQMFVLILMTHGASENSVLDSHYNRIYLEDIKRMLSPNNFPAMKGKPKMMIVQACSGSNKDFGTIPHNARDPRLCVGPADPIGQPFLNADDFIMMRAAGESYTSKRSPTHGSLFISELVSTFYEHACHKDVEELFKIVQHQVREKSIKLTENERPNPGGQLPVSQCTFTNFRKLYIFPRYNPTKENSKGPAPSQREEH